MNDNDLNLHSMTKYDQIVGLALLLSETRNQ